MKIIYKLLRKLRYKLIKKYIGLGSVLEVGSSDDYLKRILPNKKVFCTDLYNKELIKIDAENILYPKNSCDTVVCMEVLEHLKNPIKAMNELKRVTRIRLIITVPYEPYFSLFRLFNWEKEHLWTIRPTALKEHLGNPRYEHTFFCNRYYLGIWDMGEK